MSGLALRDRDVSWTATDTGGVVVLDLASSKYYELNGTGAVLWTALAAGSDRDTLAADLTRRFGIERDRAGADVEAFLAQLGGLGLLRDIV